MSNAEKEPPPTLAPEMTADASDDAQASNPAAVPPSKGAGILNIPGTPTVGTPPAASGTPRSARRNPAGEAPTDNTAAENNNIKVFARFRPPNSRESLENGQTNVSFDEKMTTVHVASKDHPGSFVFDRVFDWNCTQEDVFQTTASTIVDDVLKGYNGTAFAYGQTGAGKTFTMMGGVGDDGLPSPETKGLVPRIAERIFALIAQAPATLEFTVRVSYMEIYMERLRDLLNPTSDNLPVHEDKARGVYVKGLLEVYVASVAEVLQVMQQGQTNRMVAATQMNAESSRSHSIFVVHIQQKAVGEAADDESGAAAAGGGMPAPATRTGRLYLVDLAGSEKVGKTGATGQTLEEAKKINKSLSALGNVINALTDGRASHIPYRDSKLTRILQESLGGNSRTTLIINCSPSSFNEAETLSTLRFGQRAKTIKNKAKVNVELGPADLKRLLRRAQVEVMFFRDYSAALEREVGQWRAGAAVPADQWAQMPAMPVSPRSPTGFSGGFPAEATGGLRPGSSAGLLASPLAAQTLNLADDERDAYLRRENALQDQLVAQESEVASMRERESAMVAQVADMQLLVDRLQSQAHETQTASDELRERDRTAAAALNDRISALETQLESQTEAHRAELEHERQRLRSEKVQELVSAAAEIDQEPPARDLTAVSLPSPTAALAAPQTLGFPADTTAAALAQQVAVLESQRRRWLTDVQDRCEKVVDLEMTIEELRDENERLRQAVDSTNYQKKLAFLERNLEQLGSVQAHLADELTLTRKKHQLDLRRLQQRDEQVATLEAFISNLPKHLKGGASWNPFSMGSTSASTNAPNALVAQSRIARPLRGGGALGVPGKAAIEGE